ncbi:unnamed protein product [Diamesa hyperborea]
MSAVTKMLINDIDGIDVTNLIITTTTELVENVTNHVNMTEMTLDPPAEEADLIHNQCVQIVFSILYFIIFILGIFGNFLVCFVVVRQRTMQTVTNFFISNLAIADILLCLFCVPLTPIYTFLGRWIFGTFLCHLVALLQCCCVYLSTLTLTSIAIDRFFVIIYPFRPRMKVQTCLVILIVIWIFAFALTYPYGHYMKISNELFDNGEKRLVCEEHWPTEDVRKIFGTVTSVLQFFLPFFIILICYLCIFCKLKNNKRRLQKSKNAKKKNSCEKILRKKTSTNQMLVLMVTIFGCCWLPLNLINIMEDFNVNLNETKYYNFFFFASHLIAMSSVVYNPFLYAWLNENFRKEFKQILPCIFVNISTHRERKTTHKFFNTFKGRKSGDDNLIDNGGRGGDGGGGNNKTIQETKFLHKNKNVMINVEPETNYYDENSKQENEDDVGNVYILNNHQTADDVDKKNNLVVGGCYDEIISSEMPSTDKTSTTRVLETSIS